MSNIPDGSFDTIELRQVVSSIKMMCRIEGSDHDRWLEKIVNDGAKRIDAGSQYLVQDAVLDVIDNEFSELPCDFDQLISLRYGSGTNCYGIYYVDLPFLKSCGCTMDNAAHFGNFMRIQDGKIFYYFGVVSPPGSSVEVTQVTLNYWAINKDENGLRVIYSAYEEALTHFGCWKFATAYYEKFPRGWAEEQRQNYVAQKEYIIGKWQQQQFRNKKRQVASTMNAIVNSKVWPH